MPISMHPYRSEADLLDIQTATATWISIAGFRGNVNVSDIALRLFNGQRRYDPREIVRLWKDEDGQLVGWAMVYPAWHGFEVQLHPDYRQQQLASDILDWAEHELIGKMNSANVESPEILLDVYEGDNARIILLEQRGYSFREQTSTISTRSLAEPIPSPQLPQGFSIRSMEGDHEAGKLVALFNDSFGFQLTAEGYQQWMHSPTYRVENELVVVAPDGRFASSCILLPDNANQSGMFENVGTGIEFRRLGLAKALLYAGMQRFQAQGFKLAMVPHRAEKAAAGLYYSAGFRPSYPIYRYTKAV